MCLIAFAYHMHPEYNLVLIANRDEFYKRPTRAAQFWSNEGTPELLAGKDLQGGGTWMGITKSGKWGALTNYRDPSWKRENPPTRGNIVLDYLQNEHSPEIFVHHLRKTAQQFEGFNVLAGDSNSLFHYSNANDKITPVEPGIHGVSNAVLDTPWPKLEYAKNQLEQCVTQNNITPESLFQILKNEQHAADDDLPKTGIPYEWEKAISPVFIQTENYGTRSSSLLYVKRNGSVRFLERRYSTDGKVTEDNEFAF